MNRLLKRARGRVPIHGEAAIQGIIAASEVAATILERLCRLVEPGISTYDIEMAARELFRELGAESPCYNYALPEHHPFPGYICLSLNDEIVHGSGSLQKVVREGDNLTVDVAVRFNGWIGDNARTVGVGRISDEMLGLLDHTQRALETGIAQALPGNRVGNVSHAIQKYVEKHGYSVVREYCGHGVGRTMHEEPQVPNFGKPKDGAKLYPGMILAIEPMVNLGRSQVKVDDDTWTARTADGQPAAHFEHTVLVTENEPKILTVPQF